MWSEGADSLGKRWNKKEVEEAARAENLPVPQLVRLSSPYRFVVQPVIDHVLKLERTHRDREIAVVIPMLVEPRWDHYFLHNQRTELLSGLLLLKGDRRIVIVNVPWYLR
jgi:hypothetical protein